MCGEKIDNNKRNYYCIVCRSLENLVWHDKDGKQYEVCEDCHKEICK